MEPRRLSLAHAAVRAPASGAARLSPQGSERLPEFEPVVPPEWSFRTLAGRISELCAWAGGASLTAAAWILRQAQQLAEPVAWIAAGPSTFYPPDFHDFGIDLDALAVVRAAGPLAGARASEHLLRSGAFGLVVLDLEDCAAGKRRGGRIDLSLAVQTRLSGLCRRHQAALLCLTAGEEGSSPLGSLVSLRGGGSVRKTSFDRYRLELQILKDKRQGPGWSHAEVCRGPDGMC